MAKVRSNLKKDPFAEREAARYDRPVASREYILQLVQDYTGPCTRERLIQILKLKEEVDIEALTRRLSAMVRDGQLILNRREGYLPVNERDLVRGRIIAHPDGYGFLHPEEGGDDLFISPKQMRSLLHGDRVVMRVVGVDRRGRREAVLIEVLERANTHVVGRLCFEGSIAFVVADNKRITQDILIAKEALNGAEAGQIVVAEITEDPTAHHPPIGRIEKVLGEHMAPGMEIEMAIAGRDIPNVWSDEVLQETAGLGAEVVEADKQGRLDLRDKPLVTIDGEDAKDFDDAVYCEQHDKGWRLYVAIADVSFYVQQHTGLDKEASRRGTSVYFPGQVVPMLPEALSNGLCSLNPNVDRLSMVCMLEFDRSGICKRYEFHEAVIRSAARLTYTEVAAALVEREVAVRKRLESLLPDLQRLYDLYRLLIKQREKRGAIDFDSTETQIIFGPERKIADIVPVERNDAHRLIEEFMIAANIAAAEFLAKHKVPCLYRVHEPPPADKLEDLATFLNELGLKMPFKKKITPKQLAAMLRSVRGRPDEHLIQTVMLRSLSQAEYIPENLGHFGLALAAYAHFTSPIRRYPDLLVHRAIRHVLQGGRKADYGYTLEEMRQLGEHSSMTERRADEATRDVVDWLKCEYLQDHIGQSYEGIITGVTTFGVFVELKDIYVEGLVHITTLPKDYYHYDAVHHRLLGERSGQQFQLGDNLTVTVAAVSLDERNIDFELSGLPKKSRRRR